VAVFYVVYVEVEADAAAEWEAYMRGHHIQEVVDTGCFKKSAIVLTSTYHIKVIWSCCATER
jgi:hypothetical protein